MPHRLAATFEIICTHMYTYGHYGLHLHTTVCIDTHATGSRRRAEHGTLLAEIIRFLQRFRQRISAQKTYTSHSAEPITLAVQNKWRAQPGTIFPGSPHSLHANLNFTHNHSRPAT